MERFSAWLRRVLADDRIVRWTLGLTVLLSFHVLFQGYLADDHALRGLCRRIAPWDRWMRSPFDLFSFYDGEGEGAQALLDLGFSPWWTDPALRISFFRPLSSITHWIDFQIDSPILAHAQSLAFYLGVIAASAAYYRRFLGKGWVFGLAVVMFAMDNNHAVLIEWIANRNALVAGLFGIFALVLQDRARVEGRPVLRWLAAACLALALMGGEQALGAVAYVGAYALFLDDRSLAARAKDLLPHAVVVLVWLVVYKVGRFGAHGSGVYVDPVDDPRAFLGAAAVNIPLLLQSELGGFPTDLLVILPTLPPAVLVVSFVLVAVALLAFAPLCADRRARYLLAGALLSVIPSAATLPSGRLMLFPSLGLLALLALVIEGLVDRTRTWAPGPLRWAAVFTAVWMGGRHFFLSPLTLQIPLQQFAVLERVLARYGEGFGSDRALAKQRVVVVNPPDPFFTYYLASMRVTSGQIVPASILVFASGRRPIEIERLDDATLVVRQDSGFYHRGTEVLTRRPDLPMPAGSHVGIKGVDVDVLRADANGIPTEVRFRFASPLESATLKWLAWRGKEFVPFELPAVGATTQIAAQTLAM